MHVHNNIKTFHTATLYLWIRQTTASVWSANFVICNYKKKWNLIQKQPSCKKVCGPQECCCEKRCEIQGGGQEMAVIVG